MNEIGTYIFHTYYAIKYRVIDVEQNRSRFNLLCTSSSLRLALHSVDHSVRFLGMPSLTTLPSGTARQAGVMRKTETALPSPIAPAKEGEVPGKESTARGPIPVSLSPLFDSSMNRCVEAVDVHFSSKLFLARAAVKIVCTALEIQNINMILLLYFEVHKVVDIYMCIFFYPPADG